MTRHEANRKILDILLLYIDKHPEMRFSQALHNLGIVRDWELKTFLDDAWEDEFYTESIEILDRMVKDE